MITAAKAILLVGGNHYGVKPSYGGRQDAGFGTHLTYSPEQGFSTKTHQESGFYTEGEVRSIELIQISEGDQHILVGLNDSNFGLIAKF